MAVLITRSLLKAFCTCTVFRIHKPVIWSQLNVLVVFEIVQSMCLWSAVCHAQSSLQGKNSCYTLQELSLSHVML